MIERGKTVFRTMFGKLHSLEIGCQRKWIERDFCKTEFSLEFFGNEFLCLFIDEVGNDKKTRQTIRNQQNNEDNLEPFGKTVSPERWYALQRIFHFILLVTRSFLPIIPALNKAGS